MRRSDVAEVAALAREVARMADELHKMSPPAKGEKAPWDQVGYDHGIHTAALRRRSMDLTRSLARLRNPWRQS
jgi:hypothetical protein